MANKRNLIIVIVLLIVFTLTVVIGFSLELTKSKKKKDSIEVASYTESKNETNSEIDNEVEDERIVVILPNENTIPEEKPAEPEKPTTPGDNKPNNNSSKKYYIKVNNSANVVTVYTKDSSGQYTVPVKAMVCSTGTDTPTSGTYGIKLRWEWLALFGNVYGHYSTQIVGNILFHSVPYLRKGDPSSLEYWEYDKLGTSCSAGCVRLTVQDAKWIYNNIEKGTIVEFYSSSNPGPLRKTTSTKNIRK